MDRRRFAPLLVAAALLGCQASEGPQPPAATPADREAAADPPAAEQARCHARIAAALRADPLPGAPEFEARRASILGRARGEAVLWAREPAPTADAELPAAARAARAALAGERGPRRVVSARRRLRHDPPALRALILREGYLYSSDPAEALALVQGLTLTDLFTEPELYLARGSRVERLVRSEGRRARYEHADGPAAGQPATLLLGDRVATTAAALAEPRHRDVAGFAEDVGADRVRVEMQTARHVVARLHFGDTWVRALLGADGARLSLACLDADPNLRRAVTAWQAEDRTRREALTRLRAAVTAAVAEAIPFDRPRGAPDHLQDGQLRPLWRWAYEHGHTAFEHEGRTYPVFDAAGRPLPPQMCVDFVLDSYERASGTWFEARPAAPDRRSGGLDFGRFGIGNRSGVLAFEAFAARTPELFEHRRFAGAERIPFAERERFFAALSGDEDGLRAGDVVAIQGVKADGLVHQHAILVEGTDPITGFPHALSDQMRWPRRRTWEGIMAEAPRRSLLFRVRPRPALFRLVAAGS
ncbi:MAG TPA: hypothetical protein PLU22_08595 [Polyangiaceae bacterium]|nr:hypothetical protein [Polyangiaceae bacterium]